MSGKPFAARPAAGGGDPEAWVKSTSSQDARANPFSARLTIDVTPACRGRMKIAAFARGQTVADMVRALFDREFPEQTP